MISGAEEASGQRTLHTLYLTPRRRPRELADGSLNLRSPGDNAEYEDGALVLDWGRE